MNLRKNAPDDVGNFHSAFTSMPVVDSPPDATALSVLSEKAATAQEAATMMMPTSSTADDDSATMNDVFRGFSFVASCVLHESRFEEFYRRHRQRTMSSDRSSTDHG